MIAPMSHITLMMAAVDQEKVLNVLQQLGIVHVTMLSVSSQPQQELAQQLIKIKQALAILPDSKRTNEILKLDTNELVSAIITAEHQLKQNLKTVSELKQKLEKLQPWQSLDLDRIAKIKNAGVHILQAEIPIKTYEKFDFGQLVVMPIYKTRKTIYAVLLSDQMFPTLPFTVNEAFSDNLSEIEQELYILNQEIALVRSTLQKFGTCKHELINYKDQIENQLQYEQIKESSQTLGSGDVLMLKGWIPSDAKDRLENTLANLSVAWILEPALPNKNTPVLLKNNPFNRFFEPITKIFQLPNYVELDLTPFIAVFYPIFFAYCLGDSGYGLLLIIASLLSYRMFLRDTPNLAILGLILGVMTTVMGLVKSGSVFGIPLLELDEQNFLSILKPLVWIPDDQKAPFSSFNVALMIGVFQIYVAMMIAIYKKSNGDTPFLALSVAGKLVVVTGVLIWFLGSQQNVEFFAAISHLSGYIILVGLFLFIWFSDVNQKPLSRMGSQALPVFFIFTGLLGDVLSYVRLFALGVASAVLGLVINNLAMQMMGDEWWQLLIGILFLIVGHSINLALAILGAFVHPLRLTFVEFYNNAQFEGGGVEYSPFQKKVNNQNIN